MPALEGMRLISTAGEVRGKVFVKLVREDTESVGLRGEWDARNKYVYMQ